MADYEREKQLAAEAAAELAADGMRVGLGTGSTVAYFLRALAARSLDVACVATSQRTEEEARALGLRVERFERLTGSTSQSTVPTRSLPPAGWSKEAAAPTRGRRSSPPPRIGSS